MIFSAFFLPALLGGIGIAVAAAPLGCFVLWRRMAFLGDASAHAAVLGVVLAMMFQLPIMIGVLGVAFGIAIALARTSRDDQPMDTTLAVIAYSGLAIGLVAAQIFVPSRVDLEGFLFGDILSLSRFDVISIWVGAGVIAALSAWQWRRLLVATLSVELSQSDGGDPKRTDFYLILTLSLFVAIAFQIIGALLLAAMLVIPPATARQLARSPEQMALAAAVIGAVAAAAGLFASLGLDTPSGPSIAIAAMALFLLSLAARPLIDRA